MFSFDQTKTTELAMPSESVELDAQQKELFRELAAIVAPALGLDPIPCLGLMLRAVSAWQVEHEKPATGITDMNAADRARAALEIRDHFIVLARELLKSPEQRAALSHAIEDAFALYMKKYNRRAR